MEELTTQEEVAVEEPSAPAEEVVVEVVAEPEVLAEEPTPSPKKRKVAEEEPVVETAIEEPVVETLVEPTVELTVEEAPNAVEEVEAVAEEEPVVELAQPVADPNRIVSINGLHISIK